MILMERIKGTSICLFSSKGGVGKTINIMNLAGIYELLEKKVLVIDFDLYTGDIALISNKKTKKDLYDLSLDLDHRKYNKITNYITKIDDYIDILASPKDPRISSMINTNYINKIIKDAKEEYDVVLVDTNHALNDVSLSVLDSVDKTILITTNDPLDIKSMRTLISIFKEEEYTKYKVLLNNSRDPYKMYFTLFDIKKMINHNIDYTLSEELYIKDIEKYIMDGKILTLERKFPDLYMRDYKSLVRIATDMLEGDKNE